MKYLRKALLPFLLGEVLIFWYVDRVRPHDPVAGPGPVRFLAPIVDTFSATPSSLVFTSSDPDSSVTRASSVYARVVLPVLNKPWAIQVQADSPTLTNCASVPVSTITATCSSVSVSGGLLNGPDGACRPSFTLSTSPTTVAAGLQGDAGIILFPDNYTVNTTYRFTDSWQYRGASTPACGLSLTYTLRVDY